MRPVRKPEVRAMWVLVAAIIMATTCKADRCRDLAAGDGSLSTGTAGSFPQICVMNKGDIYLGGTNWPCDVLGNILDGLAQCDSSQCSNNYIYGGVHDGGKCYQIVVAAEGSYTRSWIYELKQALSDGAIDGFGGNCGWYGGGWHMRNEWYIRPLDNSGRYLNIRLGEVSGSC